jgi:hypothetical protein
VRKPSLFAQPGTSKRDEDGEATDKTEQNRAAAPEHIDPLNVKASFYSLLNRKDQLQQEGSERSQQEHHDFWLDRAMTELADHVLRMTRYVAFTSSPTQASLRPLCLPRRPICLSLCAVCRPGARA